MQKFVLICACFLGLVFQSCSEKEIVVPEFVLPDSDRVVLIEELTGVSCPNCPKGTAELENLIKIYKERIIVVAVHGGFLAWPNSHSKKDFRTDDSNALEAFLQAPDGKPCASFNRIKQSNGSYTYASPEQWSGIIKEELEKPHLINLDLITEYDESTRELTVKANCIPKENLGAGYKITVMLLEDKIIDAQETSVDYILDYEFNHMLREILTQVTGDPISTDLVKDQVTSFEYKFTLPTEPFGWNPDHMDVVMFIHRGDTEEVLQAIKTKLKP